jgi:SNF2 family DNA or RNA helicase
MAHLGSAHNEEEEQTSDQDGVVVRHGRRYGTMTTDEYIESLSVSFVHPLKANGSIEVVGSHHSSDSNSDIQVPDNTYTTKTKRKLEPGKKVLWDGDESDEDPFAKFQNSKKIKRQKNAQWTKRVKAKAKDAHEEKKRAKKNGEATKKERIWGDGEDYDDMGADVPAYLRERRQEFDQKCQVLEEAGLKLPPSYDDVEFSDDERLANLEERPYLSKNDPSRPYKDISLLHSGGLIPAATAQYLRDYQVDGVAFLHELFVYQRGGILGDDMGLGKTIQVAAFLTAAYGKTGDERDRKRMRKMRQLATRWYPRILIVCPSSLMENWRNELNNWGFWHIDLYHGRTKQDVLEAVVRGRLEIVITTYKTYTNDKEELNSIQWDCVVADECHQIKSLATQVTQAMNEVNALCRIGLTGTAIQNKYEELWALLNWTNPGRFGQVSIS